MVRPPFALLLLVLSSAPLRAQDDAKAAPRKEADGRPLHERFWFGGGIGLAFGTVTAIQLDPLIGYKVDPAGRFSTSVGFSYWYYRDNRFTPPYDFSGFGYRAFSRYRVVDPVFLHAEFLNLNVDRYSYAEARFRKMWVPHLLVGGGYVQSLGGRSAIYLQVLWEVLQDPNSVYLGQGPVVSGGFGLGL
ncbi:MAG: hypothetical protein QY325_01030 [Flavobacteriales bacterium]|nr:MAG: hypothetical protein QY325_01030 [Flavobacteriales bacterium]